MKLNVQRLFVGNLPSDIKEKDIKQRFAEYGNVQSTEIKNRPDGSVFAYINLEADRRHIDECLQNLPKKKWNGHNVKVELAKESFLVRLARERKEQQSTLEQNKTLESRESAENLTKKRKSRDHSGDDTHLQITNLKQVKRIKFDLEYENRNSDENLGKKRISRNELADGSSSPMTCLSPAKMTRVKLETEDSVTDETMYNKKLPMFRGIANSLKECDSELNAVRHHDDDPKVDAKLTSRTGETKQVVMNENLKLVSISDSHKHVQRHKIKFEGDNKEDRKEKISNFHIKEAAQNKNTPVERSMISEEKRLKSIEEKRKSFNNQLQTVKRALSVVDAPKNKKIVFSDDETPDDGLDNRHEESINTDDKKEATKISQLFNDDTSDDEPDMFQIKAQFEGRKGQKLLELQSRYANDKRFTLDERFYESDESEGGQDMQNENLCDDEKTRQLNILQDVLGDRLHVPLKKKEKSENKSVMLRFDPLKEDHKKFEVAKEPVVTDIDKNSKSNSTQKPEKKLKKENNTVEDVEIPKVEVSKEKFYTVTDRLKETLKNKNKSETQFSLLEMFGPKNQDEGESSAVDKYEHTEKPKKNQIGWQRNPFKYDSSDSEEEENTEHAKKLESQNSESYSQTNNYKSYKCFFFKENDARFKEGLEFLTSAKKMGEEEFAKRRRELKQIIRSKIKNNLKKKNPWKKKLGGQKKKFSKKKN